MATYLLVRHQVREFTEWKRAYDTHRPKCYEAGLTENYLLRGADNPNEVILLFEARDINQARGFAGSADLREILGVRCSRRHSDKKRCCPTEMLAATA